MSKLPLIIDGHLDLSMNAMEWNRDLRQSVATIRSLEKGMTDKPDRGNSTVAFPEMRAGNVGLCFGTLIARYAKPTHPLGGWRSPAQAWGMVQAQLAWYEEMIRQGELRMIKDVAGLDGHLATWERGDDPAIGFLLTLEGADSIVTFDHLYRLYERGLRAIGPAHYGPGTYAFGTNSEGSIGQPGRELLRRMDELGIVLDVTHLCDTSFWEAMDAFTGIVWASHSNCRALVNHNRQFSDDQLKALIERDAVIGMPLDAWMMVPGWVRGQSRPETTGVNLQKMIDHMDHVCQLAGNTRHVAIGTDLDGGFGTEQGPADVDTITDLQKLPALLAERGYGPNDVAAVCHGNWLRILRTALGLLLCLTFGSLSAQELAKERLIVLTDIEADPDDTQSLVRLFLYANQLDIKGLVATTSCWMTSTINPASIQRVIDAYGEVRPNLLRHETGYPTAESLSALIKRGLPKYGMTGVGEGMDSEGSDWIIKTLEEPDDRPLWISVWGGVNTLAQALYKIRGTKSEPRARELIAKLRVYTISDQDDSGIWIRNNFPDLFYIVSPGDNYADATWTGINAYIEGIDNEEISNGWIARNIQRGHGPLGAVYPDVAWGVEGDTPAFLSLIPNGLNVPEHPDWGGWGGRYERYLPDFAKTKKGGSIVEIAPETRPIWTNVDDSFSPYVPQEYGRTVRPDTATFTGYRETLWRWRDDFQNDFAARMDWCTLSFDEANHPPVPVLSHPENLTIKSGRAFSLDALNSTDPDGDNLSFLWFYYPEAGTYQKDFSVGAANNVHLVHLTAPEVTEPVTLHIILKVSDKGTPVLSRYKRVIVRVVP